MVAYIVCLLLFIDSITPTRSNTIYLFIYGNYKVLFRALQMISLQGLVPLPSCTVIHFGRDILKVISICAFHMFGSTLNGDCIYVFTYFCI